MRGPLRVLTAAGGVALLAAGVLLAVLGAGAGRTAVMLLAGITGAVLVGAGVTFLYASRTDDASAPDRRSVDDATDGDAP